MEKTKGRKNEKGIDEKKNRWGGMKERENVRRH